MKMTQLLALHASKSAVSDALLSRAVVYHAERKAVPRSRKYANGDNSLASRPHSKFAQAVSRKISPADTSRGSEERPRFRVISAHAAL
jgi:hypothetical protein